MSTQLKAGLAIGLALLLLFGGWYLHHIIVTLETQIATAQAHEEQLVKDNAKVMQDFVALQQTNKQETARREELEKENATLTEKLARRNTQTAQQVAKVTAPDRDAFGVATDLSTAYGLPPVPVSADKSQLYITLAQAQQMTAAKIEHDATQQNIADMQNLLDLQKQMTASVQNQLAATQKQLVETQAQLDSTTKMMKEYKKVSVKSMPRKILDGAAKVGIFVLGAALGHVL